MVRKDVTYPLRVKPELHAFFKALADREERSMNWMLNKALSEWKAEQQSRQPEQRAA